MMATMMLASRAVGEKRRIYAHGLSISRSESRPIGVSASDIPLIDLLWTVAVVRSANKLATEVIKD